MRCQDLSGAPGSWRGREHAGEGIGARSREPWRHSQGPGLQRPGLQEPGLQEPGSRRSRRSNSPRPPCHPAPLNTRVATPQQGPDKTNQVIQPSWTCQGAWRSDRPANRNETRRAGAKARTWAVGFTERAKAGLFPQERSVLPLQSQVNPVHAAHYSQARALADCVNAYPETGRSACNIAALP